MLFVWVLVLNVGANSPPPKTYLTQAACLKEASYYAERNYIPPYITVTTGKPWYECVMKQLTPAEWDELHGKRPEGASNR